VAREKYFTMFINGQTAGAATLTVSVCNK